MDFFLFLLSACQIKNTPMRFQGVFEIVDKWGSQAITSVRGGREVSC
jgi:hypothetical protein